MPNFEIDQASLDALGPDERKKLERELAELQRLIQDNPAQGYFPHQKQIEFHLSRDPIKAFLGGNRSGKTTAGILDDIIQAVDREALPAHLQPYKRWEPPFYCRIVAPDFTATLEGVIFPKIREWAPRGQLKGGSWERAFDKQLRRLMFANGSWFQFMTFEQDIDKFGGAALHRVHHDEEPPEDIRKECQMRLIDYGGDELFTMTPLQGMTWMHDGIYLRRDESHITVVEVDMDDNPHLDSVTKERILDGLTEEERKARKEGKFVHFGGMVFDELVEGHMVPPIDPGYLDGQTVYVGIDPGLNKTAVVWAAFDRENAGLVFDELYLDNVTVQVACEHIKQKNRDWGIQPHMYIIDPSARNRTLTNAEQVQGEYARFGIYCAPGQNAIEPGIFQLKRRLQADPPAIRISKACRWLVWEMRRYRREQTPDGAFKPVDKDNHLIDALRYVFMARPWGAPPATGGRNRPRYQPGSPFVPPWDGRDLIPDAPPLGALS